LISRVVARPVDRTVARRGADKFQLATIERPPCLRLADDVGDVRLEQLAGEVRRKINNLLRRRSRFRLLRRIHASGLSMIHPTNSPKVKKTSAVEDPSMIEGASGRW